LGLFGWLFRKYRSLAAQLFSENTLYLQIKLKDMAASAETATPFTNLQMEILRVYALDLPDEDLLAIRRMIARYLLEKTRKRVNTISKDRGYTQETLVL